MRVKSFKNNEGLDIFQIEDKKTFIHELVSNKQAIIKAKKQTISEKNMPAIITKMPPKVTENSALSENEMIIEVVGNMANYMDMDDDVILMGAYNKSISDKGANIPFLKDHHHSIDGIIGETKRCEAKMLSMQELGIDSDIRQSEAFVQTVLMTPEVSGKAFTLYKRGMIKQHSIGLRYINVDLAVNNSEFTTEYETWDKFYKGIINKERADEMGYFWAVREIAIMENSAVVFGSNEATPTLDIQLSTASTSIDETESQQALEEEKSLLFYSNLFAK